MKDKIKSIIDNIAIQLDSLSLEIYSSPELGFEEYKSSKAHMDLLEKYGFEMEKNYCGLETGFKAIYASGKKGPTIAYMSEYDALPGVGHGCGHNILGATSTGAGIVLKHLIDDIGGRVIVFGTPAEETSGAKVTYVENGAFDDVDIALVAHPASSYRKSGSSLALQPLQVEFYGKTSHAASEPEKGINALDGLIMTFNSINALREHIISTSRIHGVIKNGGEAANVVPDYAMAQFYIRSKMKKDNVEIVEKVKNCARGAALQTGARLEMSEYELPYDNLVTNQGLNQLFTDAIKEYANIDMLPAAESTGSLDAGNVSHVCPTIHPYFDITNDPNIPAHTRQMADCTLTDYAKEQMRNTIGGLVLTAVKYIQDEEIQQKIREEFLQAEK